MAGMADAALDPRDIDASVRQRCEAWLALQRALAFEPEHARRLLEGAVDPVRALAAAGNLPGLERVAAATDRDQLARIGGLVVPWSSPLYPGLLRPLADAPPVLCLRGDPAVLDRPAVAIVGARAATVSGLDTAHALGAALAHRGLVVVSGLARGIDAAAHRGALEAGGLTVAVQACGLDRVYPAEHRGLASDIAAAGAVVSELPLGTPPRPVCFPLRNRVISGLSLATVVVEARLRSGSLVTAGHAAVQGREVLAVPGALREPTSEGPNRLLRDGARPLIDVDDVLAALPATVLAGLVPRTSRRVEAAPRSRTKGAKHGAAQVQTRRDAARGPAAEARRGAARKRIEPPRLDERDQALLAALEHEAQGRDGLTRTLDWTVAEVASRLLALELEGLVHQDRSGRFRRRRPPDLGGGGSKSARSG